MVQRREESDEANPARGVRPWTRVSVAIITSILLHVPLTPLLLLLGFLIRLAHVRDAQQEDYEEVNPTTLSVDLVELPPFEPLRAEAEPAAQDRLASARTGEASAAAGDSEPRDPAVDPPRSEDASADSGEAAGDFGLLKGEPNVTVELWFSAMRAHPLASSLDALLACGHMGAALRRAGTDPLEDFDAAMFAGPQLNDPSKYTMALQHHLPEARVLAAIGRLMFPSGRWIAPKIARITAAGATRIVFPHGPSLLVATPEKVYRKLGSLPQRLSIPPAGGRALSVSLRDPALPLRRLGIDVPKSLQRMRLDVSARAGGSIGVTLRFDDRDDGAARADAPRIGTELENALLGLGQFASLAGALAPLFGLHADLSLDLPRLDLVSDGSAIVGEVELSPTQVAKLLARVTPFICLWPEGETPRAPPNPAAR